MAYSYSICFPDEDSFFYMLIGLPVIFPFRFSYVIHFFIMPFCSNRVYFHIPFHPEMRTATCRQEKQNHPYQQPFLNIKAGACLYKLIRFYPPISIQVRRSIPMPHHRHYPITLFQFFDKPFQRFFLRPGSCISRMSPGVQPTNIADTNTSLIPSDTMSPHPCNLSPGFHTSIHPYHIVISYFVHPPGTMPTIYIFSAEIHSRLRSRTMNYNRIDFPHNTYFLRLIIRRRNTFSTPSYLTFLYFRLLLCQFYFMATDHPPHFIFLLLP